MKLILTLSILFLLAINLTAQPYGPQFPAPFGFIEILIGAGALFGGKKMYDSQKKKEEE